MLTSNRGVTLQDAGRVDVLNIDFPKLEMSDGPGLSEFHLDALRLNVTVQS